MRYAKIIIVILTVTFVTAARSEAQFYSELSFPLTATALSVGGGGASFTSDDPFAATLNPAQLGLFSLSRYLSVGLDPRVPVPTNYPALSSLWYLTGVTSAYAVNLGLSLNQYLHELPFKISLGIGYSHVRYDFGNASSGPSIVSRSDYINDVTIALGLKYVVTLGIGYTMNPVTSSYKGGVRPWSTSTVAQDIGAILKIPVLRIASKFIHKSLLLSNNILPIADVTLGYSARNFGNHLYYETAALPREADLGWNVKLGLETRIDRHRWRWVSFTIIREADASLIALDSTKATVPFNIRLPNSSYNYYYAYRQGLGGFNFYNNLIAGKSTAFDGFTYGRPAGDIGVLKGAQIELGQFVYLRQGSVTEAGLPTYTTYGWGAKLDGLVKTLLFLHWLKPDNKIVESLLDHFNLEFAYSKATGGPFQDKSFETLDLVLR